MGMNNIILKVHLISRNWSLTETKQNRKKKQKPKTIQNKTK